MIQRFIRFQKFSLYMKSKNVQNEIQWYDVWKLKFQTDKMTNIRQILWLSKFLRYDCTIVNFEILKNFLILSISEFYDVILSQRKNELRETHLFWKFLTFYDFATSWNISKFWKNSIFVDSLYFTKSKYRKILYIFRIFLKLK